MRFLKKIWGFLFLFTGFAGVYITFTSPKELMAGNITGVIFCELIAFLLLKKPKNKANQPDEQNNVATTT